MCKIEREKEREKERQTKSDTKGATERERHKGRESAQATERKRMVCVWRRKIEEETLGKENSGLDG